MLSRVVPGLVIDDHPLFTEHAVDQGRLADVGPADDGDLDAVLLAGPGMRLASCAFQHFLLGALFRSPASVGNAPSHVQHLGVIPRP